MLDVANNEPDVDPIQKKTDSLLVQLGLHPSQIAAQQHLGNLMSGVSSASKLTQAAQQPPGAPAPLVQTPHYNAVKSGASPAPPSVEPTEGQTNEPENKPKFTLPSPYKVPAPIIQNTEQSIQGGQSEADRLRATGSGISQIHNPFLRTLAHIGEGAETALIPNVAALTPGTQIRHDLQLQSAVGREQRGLKNLADEQELNSKGMDTVEKKARADLTEEQANQTQALDTAKEVELAARADKENAAALAALNPQAKTGFQLWEKQNPGAKVEDYFQALALSKGTDFDKAFAQAVQEGVYQNTYGDRLKAAKDFASAKAAPQKYPLLFTPTPEGGYTPIAPKPGEPIPGNAVTAQGINTLNTPTSTERNMAGMARTVLPRIAKIESDIDKLATSIGPAVGRWNQLMVNKGGVDFPEFAKLDTNLDLLASAIVRTHFGARGGQEYRKELATRFRTAQSPENLKARIEGADEWLEGYAHSDRPGGAPPANTPAGTPPPANTQPNKGMTATKAQIQAAADRNGLTYNDAAKDFTDGGGTIR